MQSLAWWVVVFSFPFWQRLSSDIQPWVICSPHRWSSDRVQDSLKGSDFLQSFRLSPLFIGRKFPPEIKTSSLLSSFIFPLRLTICPPPMRSRCSLPLWFSVFITSVHTFKPPPAFNYHPSSSHLPPAISLQVSPAHSSPDHHAPPQLAIWPSCSPASTGLAVYFLANYFTFVLQLPAVSRQEPLWFFIVPRTSHQPHVNWIVIARCGLQWTCKISEQQKQAEAINLCTVFVWVSKEASENLRI